MAKRPQPSREDVLQAFAIDHESGDNALPEYLAKYPQFGIALVDLSRELRRESDAAQPLTTAELEYVAAKMGRLRTAAHSLTTLQEAQPKVFADAAKALGLPIQVGVAIRERRLDLASLPRGLLDRLAQALQAPLGAVQSFLALPPQVSALRASKSTAKPSPPEKVSLERLLRDAGMEEERISALLSNDE